VGARREGRTAALQVLYQVDLRQAWDALPESFDRFFGHLAPEVTAAAREFAQTLCAGVAEHRDAIDEAISRASRNWKLARMDRVDRNVLRLAAYEMHHLPDVPPTVAINEAVEIGKMFGSTDSGSFINGILDRLRRDIEAGAD